MRVLLIVNAVVSAFAAPVLAQIDVDAVSESIVTVRAYRHNRLAAEGSGFVVNAQGHVLTNAHLLVNADRLAVLALKSGAELSSRETFVDRDRNLALLRVQGLGLPPLSLSEQGAGVGRIVQSLKFGRQDSLLLSHGTIGTYLDVPRGAAPDSAVHLLQHNALVASGEFGMPLFNECGNVVAMNVPEPARGRWPYRKPVEPRGTIFALRTGDITAVLRGLEVSHMVVEDECLSAVQRARAVEDSFSRVLASRDSLAGAREDSLRKAQAKADSMRQAREDSIRSAADQRLRAERKRLESARAGIESLAQAREDSLRRVRAISDSLAGVRADSLMRVADARLEAVQESLGAVHQQEQSRASQRLDRAIYLGSALVLLALLGWFFFARRKRAQLETSSSRLTEAEQRAEAAQQAAAQAPRPAPFRCLLDGRDSAGKTFVLNIPALALHSGVTLGRNPSNSEFIVDHEAVSREHLKLTYTTGNLHAEDLDTLNGTTINGRTLNPYEPVVLQDNDRLEMGPVAFQVRLSPE